MKWQGCVRGKAVSGISRLYLPSFAFTSEVNHGLGASAQSSLHLTIERALFAGRETIARESKRKSFNR